VLACERCRSSTGAFRSSRTRQPLDGFAQSRRPLGRLALEVLGARGTFRVLEIALDLLDERAVFLTSRSSSPATSSKFRSASEGDSPGSVLRPCSPDSTPPPAEPNDGMGRRRRAAR
jgi:hypothetical protein